MQHNENFSHYVVNEPAIQFHSVPHRQEQSQGVKDGLFQVHGYLGEVVACGIKVFAYVPYVTGTAGSDSPRCTWRLSGGTG